MENKLIPQSQSSLGFFGIIRESIKTTSKNGKLVVPILLFVFISFSQLYFAQECILAPVTQHVLLELANHPNMVQDFTYHIDQSTNYMPALNDIREILVVKLLIIAISSIITLVFLIATVSSSSEAYIAKVLGLKDIFLNIKKSWQRPIVTSFYMILLSLGIGFLYMISIGIFSILAVNSWALLLLGAITLSTPVCYFYVTTLWMVSMIVSVLENVSGLKAIGRAAELMKGKRLQASFMMLLFCIAYGFILLMASFLKSYNQSLNAEMAITITFTNGFYCLLKLSMFVVYTVFYHEWKTSHDDKEGKGFYIPVTAGEV